MGEHASDPSWAAWYAQATMNARLLERLGDEMERRTGLPAAWFEVLANLKRGGPTRMNVLADALFVSRGGATRLVARLEQAGLVEREIPAADRRATYAQITAKGRAAIERALPVHFELVEELYGRHLRPGDAEAILGVAARVSDAQGWPAPGAPADQPA
jgi:DNA-binding MarR family transcriptional regulator